MSELYLRRDLSPLAPVALPNVVLRAPRVDEDDRLAAIYQAAFATRPGETLASAGWIPKWPRHPLCRRELSLIAERDEQALAYLLAYTDDDEPGEGYIGQLGVIPTARGQGIARALIARALAGFQAAGLDYAALRVAPDNAAALRLYRWLGFRAPDA